MFGLNGAAQVDSVVVQWPSGITSSHAALAAGQMHVLVEPVVSEVQTVEYSAALCPGASTWLDASEWYAVEWEGGGTEWQLEVFSEGLVTATAWNELGEQFALQYEVQQLQTTDAAWQVVPSMCGGNDASLQSSDSILILWVDGTQYAQGDEILPSGFLTVEWMDTLGCFYSSQIEIPYVEAMELLAESDTACYDEEAYYELNALHAIEPVLWLGVPSATGEIPAGSYSAACIDARGCKATIDFTIVQRLPWEFTLTADTACAASTASATYAWTGVVEPAVQLGEPLNWLALEPGVFELLWIDAVGCQAQTTFEIQEYAPLEWQVEIEGTSSTAGGALVLEVEGGFPPYDVQWSNGETGETLVNLQEGNYAATIIDAAGCTATTDLFFVPMGAGQQAEVGVIVFDPLRGIHNRSSSVHHIRLLDSIGKVVSEFTLAPGETRAVSELAKGMYFISFEGGHFGFAR
jgi:hypothetical protein